MPSHCCAPNCSHSASSSLKKTKCRMKRFPREPQRAALWEANIRSAGREDWVRKPWQSICECHFDKNQWENRLDGLKKLRPNAVPLLFSTDPPRTRSADVESWKQSAQKKFQDLRTIHSCCAVMCNHTSKTCKLKKFPSDAKRAKVWQMNIGRPSWEKTTNSYMCECHFDEEQFETNIDGIKTLRSDAVPLIFPTHVLVVHDPSSKKRWHCPKPRPPDDWIRPDQEEQQQPEVQIEIDQDDYEENAIARRRDKGNVRFESDHQYSKDAELDTLDEDEASQMCRNFCSPKELEKIKKLRQSTLDIDDQRECAESESEGLYEDVETLLDIDHDSIPSPCPSPHISDTGDITAETQIPNRYSQEPPKNTRKSIEAQEVPVEIVATPDVWSPFDVDSSVLTSVDIDSSLIKSPQLLKDALSFLQFMLPQKWMAVSEDGGIHAFLLSRTRAKAIQRSVFVQLTGGEVELYVHAVRLPKDHDIFQFISLIEPLTQDSLGDFVDSIMNVVELFVSYKVCHGVKQKQLLKEWRKFHDCLLDSNLFGEEGYFQTVRSKRCSQLSSKDSDRCENCDSLYQRYTLVAEIC